MFVVLLACSYCVQSGIIRVRSKIWRVRIFSVYVLIKLHAKFDVSRKNPRVQVEIPRVYACSHLFYDFDEKATILEHADNDDEHADTIDEHANT